MTDSALLSRRRFLMAAVVTATASVLPRIVRAPAQDPVVPATQKNDTPVVREKVSWKALPFPLKQVRLGDGPCKVAMEADRQYLHSLPPDRLLHTFRINAGIAS